MPINPKPVTPAFGIRTPATARPALDKGTPKIDCSHVKVGSVLTHKTFGKGKVVSISGGLMTVSFGKAEKRSQFPDAIKNGFLKIN